MTDDRDELLAAEAIDQEDYQGAARLLTPLADRDSVYALTTLGWMHENGHLGAPDRNLARKFYARAMSLGGAEGYLQMGWLLLTENKFAESREMFEKAKEKGSEECDDALDTLSSREAEVLSFEAIERGDYKKALSLLDSQRDRDSEYILLALGWLYQTGKAGVSDKQLSGKFYRRAAAIGCTDAHYRIGMLELEMGQEESARMAFGNGAKLRHFPAMSSLGEMMIEGIGGPIDIEQGMQLLRSAAEQGHVMSKIRLIRIEEKSTRNIIRKLFLKMKLVSIGKDALGEVITDAYSPNIYEFR